MLHNFFSIIGGDTSPASQGETIPVIRGEAAPASQVDTALANGGDIATEPPPAHRHATGLDIVRQLLEGQHGDHPAGDGSGVVVDDEDQVLSFYKDMLFSGVIQLAQKLATQHGACLALVAFWKNSLGNYHDNGKVFKEKEN